MIELSPTELPSDRLMRALGAGFVASIVIATLYPLSDWKLHTASAWAFLWQGLPRFWTWFDLLSNLFAYLLLGLLLTLGWLKRARGAMTVGVVGLFCVVLSFALEAAQSFLPGRVPSLLDWIANSLGGVVGSVIGAQLNRSDRRGHRRVIPVAERWFEQGSPAGWVMLLLWISTQLVPQRLLFATGNLRPLLQRLVNTLDLPDSPDLALLTEALWGEAAPAVWGVAIEAAVVVCAVCATGSIAFALVRASQRRLIVLLITALAAFGLRSIAMQGVYGSDEAFAWLTPGAQGGLLVGAIALYGLETLSPRARATIALTLLAIGTLLVNLAPPDRYFEDALAGFSSGRLVNLQGLLRLIALAWPLIAMAWFWRRTGRSARRSL
ncbi:MAG: VanZ family protein [Burkholderiales bacterium]